MAIGSISKDVAYKQRILFIKKVDNLKNDKGYCLMFMT